MRRSLFMMSLAILSVTGACKKDGPDPDARKDPAVPSVMSPATATADGPLAPAPPEPVVARAAEGLGKLIDRFNTCVAQVAELLRAADDRPVVSSKLATECSNAFAAILETRGVRLSEPYTEYFTLAAQVARRFAAAATATEPAASFQATEFIADYNRLALLNNELLGVPVTEPPVPTGRRRVPRRTFRDELARQGETWGKAARNWQFAHPFETLGSGAPAAWIDDALLERTRLWMLRLDLEHQLLVFSLLDCDNAGTGPEEKIVCDQLLPAGADLALRLRAWLDAWDQVLGDLVRTGQAPSTEARRACDTAQTRLEERIRELPARVE
jgi:hypothetical protein